jgi:protein gp37
MGATTNIEWTDRTFNPWIGCTKIDPACKNCYASVDTFARVSRKRGVELWGPHADRHRTSGENWKQPRRWDRAAAAAGIRSRVFCASLADVFEGRDDLEPWRRDLWTLIRETPHLDWQLLTKRPENITASLPPDWGNGYDNVWLGVTAGDQAGADKRLPLLAQVPARVRFVSYEPALESVDWRQHFVAGKFHWLIAGAESGASHRPMDEVWARVARDQCALAGVSFFLKQFATDDGRKIKLPVLDGRQHAEFPAWTAA